MTHAGIVALVTLLVGCVHSSASPRTPVSPSVEDFYGVQGAERIRSATGVLGLRLSGDDWAIPNASLRDRVLGYRILGETAAVSSEVLTRARAVVLNPANYLLPTEDVAYGTLCANFYPSYALRFSSPDAAPFDVLISFDCGEVAIDALTVGPLDASVSDGLPAHYLSTAVLADDRREFTALAAVLFPDSKTEKPAN